jgi:hypothetical protein
VKQWKSWPHVLGTTCRRWDLAGAFKNVDKTRKLHGFIIPETKIFFGVITSLRVLNATPFYRMRVCRTRSPNFGIKIRNLWDSIVYSFIRLHENKWLNWFFWNVDQLVLHCITINICLPFIFIHIDLYDQFINILGGDL